MMETSRDPREGWTKGERELFDARADHEAWSYAHEILEPWVRITRSIGSDELTQVMEKALGEVEDEVARTRDVLDALQPARREENYRDVLEELAISRGFDGAEEMARRAAELAPGYTAKKILDAPPPASALR